jgi:hypothetical protein
VADCKDRGLRELVLEQGPVLSSTGFPAASDLQSSQTLHAPTWVTVTSTVVDGSGEMEFASSISPVRLRSRFRPLKFSRSSLISHLPVLAGPENLCRLPQVAHEPPWHHHSFDTSHRSPCLFRLVDPSLNCCFGALVPTLLQLSLHPSHTPTIRLAPRSFSI